MTRSKLIVPALAAIAGATVLYGPATAHADPIGPCAEVPYMGVCVPPSPQPTIAEEDTSRRVTRIKVTRFIRIRAKQRGCEPS